MLTTNDVRVLRLLVERGEHSRDEIEAALERTVAGAAPAVRRLPTLWARGLVEHLTGGAIDITGEGARQLRRADEAAYGRWAA